MKNKKGKKLVVLGAMAALLTLIGVSGSQTYAKYIEEAKVTTQTATVAKWGFVQKVTTDELFGPASNNVGAAVMTKPGSPVGLSALSNGSYDIVQPGGNGYLTFNITGWAEVNAKFTFDADLVSEVMLKSANGEEYLPVKWAYSVEDNSTGTGANNYDIGKTAYVSFEEFELALETLEFNIPATVRPQINVTIYWQWLFDDVNDNSTPADPTDDYSNPTLVKNLLTVDDTDFLSVDEADTILAVLSKNEDSLQYDVDTLKAKYDSTMYSTEMNFSISMTAEQVQSF